MSFDGHRAVKKHDGSTDESWLTYVCGSCGTKVSGAVVGSYNSKDRTATGMEHTHTVTWLLCPSCARGSVQNDRTISPGRAFGPVIQGLPPDVEEAYREARQCIGVNAYTAAELVCRKILMHVGVEKGAAEGGSFASYLAHMEAEGYVTPPMREWVELIRTHGNRATHEIATPTKEQAEGTLMFTAELLRLTYEMEYLAKRFAPKRPESEAES